MPSPMSRCGGRPSGARLHERVHGGDDALEVALRQRRMHRKREHLARRALGLGEVELEAEERGADGSGSGSRRPSRRCTPREAPRRDHRGLRGRGSCTGGRRARRRRRRAGSTTPSRFASRNAAFAWRSRSSRVTFVSCTRPIAACMLVMRALKPTSSFSYCFSMPWLRRRRTSALDFGVACRDHAALAARHVLGRVEARTSRTCRRFRRGGRRALAPCAWAASSKSVDAALLGECAELATCRRVPVEVHRHDAHGAFGDARLDGVGPRREVVGLDVGEHRRRAGEGDRVRRRGEGERRHDDLVAGADAGSEQAEVEARRSGVDGDRSAPVDAVRRRTPSRMRRPQRLGPACPRRARRRPPHAPRRR